MPVRLVLADDHLVLRQALRALLEKRGLEQLRDRGTHDVEHFLRPFLLGVDREQCRRGKVNGPDRDAVRDVGHRFSENFVEHLGRTGLLAAASET